MKKLALLLALMLTLSCCMTAWAEDATSADPQKEAYDRASALWTEEQYDEALVIYRELAEENYPNALYMVGYACLYGRGVEKDPEEALAYLTRAAEAGVHDAFLALGRAYADGDFGEVDYVKAHEWYEKGVEAGAHKCLNNLGVLYLNGRGVAQDVGKAVSLYQQAAEHGSSTAMRNMAALYYNGEHVPQDYTAAFMWYQKATDAGDASAASYLGSMYRDGLGTEKNAERSLEMYQLAADRGWVDAWGRMAHLYASDALGEPDYAKAEACFLTGVEQGNTGHLSCLADFYKAGHLTGTPDMGKAILYYQKSIDAGQVYGYASLGVLYAEGVTAEDGSVLLPTDHVAALQLLKKAYELGSDDAHALAWLGYLLCNIEDESLRNFPFAVDVYLKADTAYTMEQLGLIYQDGKDGVPQDVAKAAGYFAKAVEMGRTETQAHLDALNAR